MAAEWKSAGHSIVVLTGAGVSAESGLATFRDAGGLWEKHRPEEIATPEAFSADPELVYRFYNARREQLGSVKPNAAHRALARLQREYPGDVFLVTQNVDDLHERGGSEQVCHMHGSLLSARCVHCGGTAVTDAAFDAGTACRLCGTAGYLRPDVVWFGEIPMHMDLIEQKLARCSLFLAVGTSGNVYPAAGFVGVAASAGACTIEINREDSAVSRHFQQKWQGGAASVVPELVEELLDVGTDG